MKYISISLLFFIYSEKVISQPSKEKASDITIEAYFPGGRDSLRKFFNKNFKQPQMPDSIDINECSNFSFKISKEGKAISIEFDKKIGYGIEEECLRILKIMPEWQPATKNSIPVESTFRYNTPVCITNQ
jgi:hypothetical protein